MLVKSAIDIYVAGLPSSAKTKGHLDELQKADILALVNW